MHKIKKTDVLSLLVLFFASPLLYGGSLNDSLYQGTRKTALFVSGQNGYHTYRIPSIILTKQNTLLAFCEGRKKGQGDSSDIDMLVKRSEDGGVTWSSQQIVWDDQANTCGNPCPVIDEESGIIYLLMTWNLGTDDLGPIINHKSKDTRRAYICHSKDDGLTWSQPIEITDTVKQNEWTWYATGPGIGIQIQHGPHKGRLVVPCDHVNDKYSITEHARKIGGLKKNWRVGLGAHVIYSDDHGITWHMGQPIHPACEECQVVELIDGTVMINMRNQYSKGKRFRAVALSKGGGESWSDFYLDRALVSPVCQGSIIRYTWPENCQKSRILFSAPYGEKREKMTVYLSYDEGKTWPFSKLLHEGPAAYSCLVVLPNGQAACLYEAGKVNPYETITFESFSLEWLTDKKDSLRH